MTWGFGNCSSQNANRASGGATRRHDKAYRIYESVLPGHPTRQFPVNDMRRVRPPGATVVVVGERPRLPTSMPQAVGSSGRPASGGIIPDLIRDPERGHPLDSR